MPQRLAGIWDDVILGSCGESGGVSVLPGTSGEKEESEDVVCLRFFVRCLV